MFAAIVVTWVLLILILGFLDILGFEKAAYIAIALVVVPMVLGLFAVFTYVWLRVFGLVT